MTKNWTGIFQQNIRTPETVDEAVEWLMTVLEDEAKSVIRSMTEEDLINLHFSLGLGLAIRNALLGCMTCMTRIASCFVHPDDASGVIITTLWRRLKIASIESAITKVTSSIAGLSACQKISCTIYAN